MHTSKGSKKVMMPKARINFETRSGKDPMALGRSQAKMMSSEKAATLNMGPSTTTAISCLASSSVAW